MIKNVYSILCTQIIEDVRTHLTSYINCVEGLKTKLLPAVLPNLNVGSLWSVEPPMGNPIKFKVRMFLKRPGGAPDELLVETSEKIIDKKSLERVNFLINGLKILSPGTHKFILEFYTENAWERSAEVLLEIMV